MKYKVIIFIIFILLATSSVAQYYDTGEDPASLKWLQIKTEKFTVIYPEAYGKGGVEFAKSLDEAYSSLTSLFPERKFKIPVVIHNYTTQANGYVAWAPRRMEIYPTPEQNSIPLDPNKQLAIHELTHVLQMEALSTGFSKAMSLILGEQFTGIISSLIPLWYYEGNAVFSESLLTESGRGRVPSFQKQLKAISVEKGSVYKYDKIVNGSYRNFVPNHYESGFQMVTWALAKYDPQIWNRMLKNTADQPFTINPVNFSLRRSSGLTKEKLFKETFDTLHNIWSKELNQNNTTSYESLNPSKKGKYINYYSPVYAGPDSIIAIKTSLSEPPSFVLINSARGTEKRIHIPGQMYPWVISYARGRLVWVESQPDPRWENREYSVLKILDVKSNVSKKLSGKSRYLAASVSPNGKVISVVENTPDNKNNLILIDAVTGQIIRTVNAPGNVYLQRPQWSAEGDKISVIYLTESGEGIMSYAIAYQTWETLLEAGHEDIQSSLLRNDSLFFVSSASGTDNIFLLSSDTIISPISNSGFGVTDINLNGRNILFCDYSSTGNNICSTTIAVGKSMTGYQNNSSSYLINRIDDSQIPAEKTENKNYIPEPYRKWQHLFRFHSWMPFYADIEEIQSDPTTIRPGVTALSQNHLSTLISSVGYEYSAEKKHILHSKVTWKGCYPVFEAQVNYGNDPYIYNTDAPGNPSEISPAVSFLNTISLPLSFSTGRFSQFLRPSFSTYFRNDYIYIKEEALYDYGQTTVSGRLYFANYHRMAMRDINPRWAQMFDLNYTFAPFDRNIYGNRISLKTAFYIPGILPNNGIKIRVEKEKQVTEKFIFGNTVSFPRSYNNLYSKNFNFISIDYVMPLLYPDFNIASLVYLKRIRTGLFYDFVAGPGDSFYKFTSNGLRQISSTPIYESFRSFGFEILSDFHLFRIPFMISGGVQAAWKDINETPSFKLLFNIDLFGMTLGKRQLQRL